MYVKCHECSKEFFIPDKQLTGGRFEFFCSNCNHKIVIISKKGKGGVKLPLYRALTDSSLTIKNLLDGIYYSFNLKNVLLSFLVQLSIIFVLSPFILIVNYNIAFFQENIVFAGILFSVLFLILTFAWDAHLYLLSLNAFSKINSGQSMQFSSVIGDIINDFKSVFLYSSGIFIALAVILSPMFLMNAEWGLAYGGLFYIIIFLLAFFLVAVFHLKKIIYAFIAYKSRGVKDNFFSLIRFIIIENINIPIYMFFINAISTIIGVILFGLFFAVTLIIAAVVSIIVAPGMMSPNIAENIPTVQSILPNLSSAGGVLFIISTLMILLFIISYIVNLTQTVSSTAIHIMKANPGESVNKNAVIIAILVISLAVSSMISSLLVAMGGMFRAQPGAMPGLM